jgi:hypothetical protein
MFPNWGKHIYKFRSIRFYKENNVGVYQTPGTGTYNEIGIDK